MINVLMLIRFFGKYLPLQFFFFHRNQEKILENHFATDGSTAYLR